MIPQLEQVAGILDEASRSLSAGKLDQACSQLTQAGSMLEDCVAKHCQMRLISTMSAAVIPVRLDEAQKPEPARALAMAAA